MTTHEGLDLATFTRLLDRMTPDSSITSLENALRLGDDYVVEVARRAGSFKRNSGDADRISALFAHTLVKGAVKQRSWGLVFRAREAIIDSQGGLEEKKNGRDTFDRHLWELLLREDFSRKDIEGMDALVERAPVIQASQVGDIASSAVFAWLHEHHPQALRESFPNLSGRAPLKTLQSASIAGPNALSDAIKWFKINMENPKTKGLFNTVGSQLTISAAAGNSEALSGLETLMELTGARPWDSMGFHLDLLFQSPSLRAMIVNLFVDNNPQGGKLLAAGGLKTITALHEAGCPMRSWRDPESGSNIAHFVASGASYAGAHLWMATVYPELVGQPNNRGQMPADLLRGVDSVNDYTRELWGTAAALHSEAMLVDETPLTAIGSRPGHRL